VADGRQELIRELFDRWNRGIRELRLSEISPDAIVKSTLTGATYKGHDGIREWMAEIDDQFDDWNVTIEEMEDVPPDRVLAIGNVHFRGRGSGVEFDQPIAWICRFSADRVTEMHNYSDQSAARDAAKAPSP
jgi:ketosteroid isomerase-like protein